MPDRISIIKNGRLTPPDQCGRQGDEAGSMNSETSLGE